MNVPAWAIRAFSPLAVRNFRFYFIGQTLSVSGTWMQRVAQSWLVLELTGSGTAIGLVTAVQFLPMLLLAPFGGVIADRFDKRRLLLLTQAVAAVLAAALGLLVVFDVVRLWMVFVLAAALGLVSSVDNPTRQTFVLEMVGRDNLTSAVSLNAVLVNLARVLGPAVAGALIVTVGLGPCFLINAGTYLAIIVALVLMRVAELQAVPPQERRAGQLREG
ncbi:MAG: MFS transporter, partial [Acidimicrobiia bacterium]